MTRKLCIALGACFCIAGPASAQSGLIEIYELALMNDPSLREAEANYFASLESKPQARSNLLPNLTLGGGKQGSFSESTQSVGFGNLTLGTGSETRNAQDNVNLNLSQALIDFTSIRSLRQADKIVAQAEINLEAARQDLLLRVAEAYFTVLAAEELLAADVAARDAIGRQLEQAQRRFDVGLIAITDVQQAQAAYDNAVATEIGSQRRLATTQEFLREIIGQYVAQLRGPTDELPLMPPDPATPDEWVDVAMEQNLLLVATRIGTEIAQDDIDILRAARLPSVDLSGTVNTSSTNNRFTTISGPTRDLTVRGGDTDSYNWAINFRMPLYTGGFNSSRIQQAVYRHRASQEGLERVARQTERETRDAYLGVISEISRVRALQQAVESNRTALRATEAGFEVGTQTTVDVLAAQNSLRRAETDYAISRYDYIVNVLRLRQASGTLTEADVQMVDGWLR